MTCVCWGYIARHLHHDRQQVRCEAGSYLRLMDSSITQLKVQGPFRTCNESKEEEEEEEEVTRDTLNSRQCAGSGAQTNKQTQTNKLKQTNPNKQTEPKQTRKPKQTNPNIQTQTNKQTKNGRTSRRCGGSGGAPRGFRPPKWARS